MSEIVSEKSFYRNIENFLCEICNAQVIGNGYTNHCSNCFYSKHVDINPGDRASSCLGMMKPVEYKMDSKKGIVLTHQCMKCDVRKNNKLASTDEVDKLLEIFKEIYRNNSYGR